MPETRRAIALNWLRGATHTVRDAAAAARRFAAWMDYRIVESGVITAALAESWNAPASAGRAYTLCQPVSGAEVFLRFVEGDPVADYLPIRSHGWAAIELCVQDVAAVHRRMLGSPFAVIGPPSEIPGLAQIYPMQVRGPDLETVYLTQILDHAPASGLPQATAPIDKLFILVLACADARASARWFTETLGVAADDPVCIRYRMISQAFGLPAETRHQIITGRHASEIVLELDQYPAGAGARPANPGALPPGVSIGTLMHPAFDGKTGAWIKPPGRLYAGRRVQMLRTPEGALLEIIDGA